MEVITGMEDFPQPDYVAVALGNFDGVHIGHQTIIKKLVEKAQREHGASVVFTFDPHPRKVLGGGKDPLLLLNIPEDKERLIGKLGVDFLLPFPFTRDMAGMSPRDFIWGILSRGLRAKAVFVGYNYTFGRRAEGNAEMLASLCREEEIEVYVIPEVRQGDITVSSSNIREYLFSGDVATANRLLGYAYNLSGTVIPGDQLGRRLGFPTANLRVAPDIVLPFQGVYAAKVQVDHDFFPAVANVGCRPTVGENLPQSIEVHIIGESLALYEQRIRVFFLDRLRGEKKFSGLDALTNQINADIETAKRILSLARQPVDL